MSGYNPYGGGYDGRNMQNMDPRANGNSGMMQGGGQSLDDIVNQNARMMRRESMPQQAYNHNNAQPDLSDMAMMGFGDVSPVGQMDGFQFDPTTTLAQDEYGNLTASMQPPVRQSSMRGSMPNNHLSHMNSSYGGSNAQYNSMTHGGSNYTSPTHQNHNNALDLDVSNAFMPSHMAMSMDFANDPSMVNFMPQNSRASSAYSQPSPFHPSMMQSPMHTSNMSVPMQSSALDPGGGAMGGSAGSSEGRKSAFVAQDASRHTSVDSLSRQPSRSRSAQYHDGGQRQSSQGRVRGHEGSSAPSLQHHNSQTSDPGFKAQPQYPEKGSKQDKGVGRPANTQNDGSNAQNHKANNKDFPWEPPEGGWPSTMSGKPHMGSVYKNAYSSTGFDMLGVLMRVATRPNPEINLGSVDLSCAFVVCDAEKDDFPIIYCSDNFERLTGYTRHMILGRNCRFLQSPDGNVAAGVKRKYVDDDSVLYLKNMINKRKEAQISLINYRRGGQPFMNLLTMIPISWDTDQVKFFVGFQVDLVEQPNSVTSRNPGRPSSYKCLLLA